VEFAGFVERLSRGHGMRIADDHTSTTTMLAVLENPCAQDAIAARATYTKPESGGQVGVFEYPERDQSRAEQDVVTLALCGRDVGQFHDGP
jgi:hypothetical protein